MKPDKDTSTRKDKGVPTADITVIIPSHDRTDLALETVRSVLAQSTPVREIIVIANGSDNHAAFWEANSGGNVRVIRERSPGQQIARNVGIEAARTSWVAFLDDDDIYLPNFIESIMPAIEDGRADIVSTDHLKSRADRVDDQTNFDAAPPGYWKEIRPRDSAVEWSYLGKFPLHLLLKRIPIYPSTTVIKRSFVQQIGGFDPRMHGIRSEDIEFLIRALTYGNLSLVWRPLVHYRIHEGNLTGDRNRRVIGKWRAFEIARKNHPDLPESFRAALDRDLPRRRRDIANLAREIGDPELFDEVWKDLRLLYRTPGPRHLFQMLHAARQRWRRYRRSRKMTSEQYRRA